MSLTKIYGIFSDDRDRWLSQEELPVAHGSLKTLSFARGSLNEMSIAREPLSGEWPCSFNTRIRGSFSQTMFARESLRQSITS